MKKLHTIAAITVLTFAFATNASAGTGGDNGRAYGFGSGTPWVVGGTDEFGKGTDWISYSRGGENGRTYGGGDGTDWVVGGADKFGGGADWIDYIGGGENSKTISAVPEAETYVLMLTGLGLMSFMVRRKKSS